MNTIQLSASPLHKLKDAIFEEKGVAVYLKRDDLLHPFVSGNKWRKLKYNLLKAKELGHDTLLTFGGAYSNHIYSISAAGQLFGFKTIGIIRGEETLPLNPTLSFAKSQGMEFHYIDREKYRDKNTELIYSQLKEQFGNFYLVPEGGSNELAIPGIKEMLKEIDIPFDYLIAPVGSGGTLAGLVAGSENKEVIGVSTLKGAEYLQNDIQNLLLPYNSSEKPFKILHDYHFGGYAKITKELILFVEEFHRIHGISLDHVYTAKMMFAIYDLIKNGYFEKGKTIIALHTGGLQGNIGMQPHIDKIMGA